MTDDFGKQLLITLDKLNRNVNELNWANIFHDSIKGCTWLDSENFAINPGRWAVGYNYFYAVFRVLNEFKPKNILELNWAWVNLHALSVNTPKLTKIVDIISLNMMPALWKYHVKILILPPTLKLTWLILKKLQ